jgi:nitrite reductase/ring-hydroxylating ferredoxin subunit
MALVNLRHKARGLPQREAIAFVVSEGSVHALQYMCAYTQSQHTGKIESDL